jgi:hypothetical protein
VRVVIVVQRQADLADVVLALDPPIRFTRGLDSRQQQGHQDRDDAEHNQELDQGQPPRWSGHLGDPLRW